MHVKTLGYPIGCPPKIFNEDYHSLRFLFNKDNLNIRMPEKKGPRQINIVRAQFQHSTFWVVYATILIYWRANSPNPFKFIVPNLIVLND